jgi:FkbM family methyltransferase
MGKVNTLDLFEDREQDIFDFYETHKNRYKKVLDIGANVGVHALLMAKQGWDVVAYEPDPVHFARLENNISAHDLFGSIAPIEMAVSTKDGYAEFIRVLDNQTASHLTGARTSYGPRESIIVRTIDCRAIFSWADFAKIDCEGSEADILLTVTSKIKCEFLVEVGTALNAARIFEHFLGKREMWAQRSKWGSVECLTDMPTHYSHGALFIGAKP